MSARAAIEAYLLDCQNRNLRPHTIATYRRQLAAFLAYAGDLPVGAIDTHTIRTYLAHLADRGLRPESIRNAGRALRAWSNFCLAEELTGADPMRRVRLPRREKPNPDAFTPEEIRRLLGATTNRRDKAIVLCLLDTGCRLTEFTLWRLGDIAGPAVTIPAENAKSHTRRVVFLGKRSRAALSSYLAAYSPRDFVWLNLRTRNPITVDGMKRAIQRIGQAAEVQPSGPHKYRRTFATMTLAAGMDIYTVADLMGHSRIDVLQHYLAADDDSRRQAHARYGPVDRLK